MSAGDQDYRGRESINTTFGYVIELERRNARLVAALRITRANNDALKDRDAKLVAALSWLEDYEPTIAAIMKEKLELETS